MKIYDEPQWSVIALVVAGFALIIIVIGIGVECGKKSAKLPPPPVVRPAPQEKQGNQDSGKVSKNSGIHGDEENRLNHDTVWVDTSCISCQEDKPPEKDSCNASNDSCKTGPEYLDEETGDRVRKKKEFYHSKKDAICAAFYYIKKYHHDEEGIYRCKSGDPGFHITKHKVNGPDVIIIVDIEGDVKYLDTNKNVNRQRSICK
jgi:hypothetical protein